MLQTSPNALEIFCTFLGRKNSYPNNKSMKTILFLTVLILASCELQYQKQLHPYNLTVYDENGNVTESIFQMYKLVERNKDFLILKSDETDTLFFDDKTHLHGVIKDWRNMQTRESTFTGELKINKYKKIEITGVCIKLLGGEYRDLKWVLN